MRKMDEKILKYEVIDWITKIDDIAMLNTLKSIQESYTGLNDWYHELSQDDIESIIRGKNDVEKGKVIDSKSLWQRYEGRLEC